MRNEVMTKNGPVGSLSPSSQELLASFLLKEFSSLSLTFVCRFSDCNVSDRRWDLSNGERQGLLREARLNYGVSGYG